MIKKRYSFIYNIILLCLVLITLYVALGQLFIVKVRNYKDTLTATLSEQLGTPVSIESIEGHWSIFSPNIVIKNIFIGNKEKNLQAEQLVVELNLPKSLVNLDIKVANIWAENLKLQVLEYPDGGWAPGGIPRQKDPITFAMILKELQRFAKISLYNSQITVFPLGEDAHTFYDINATLTQLATNHSLLQGSVYLDEHKQKPITLSLDATIIPDHWQQLDAKLYADISQIDWSSWWPKAIKLPWKFKQLEVGGTVWTTVKKGQIKNFILQTQNNNLKIQYEKNPLVKLQDTNLNVWFKQHDSQSYLQLTNFSTNIDNKQYIKLNGSLKKVTTTDKQYWQLNTDILDITDIVSLTQKLYPIPKPINTAINTVQPTGSIKDLELSYTPENPITEQLHFKADLQGVSFNPYDETVGAGNVTGHIEGGISQGYLDINSKDFSLFIAKVYDKPWSYHTAKAKLQWSYDGDAVSIFSDLMKLKADEGDITGDMMIRLYPKDGIRDYMDLRVNLTDGNASYTPKYIPTKIKEIDTDLIKWLQTAIKSGHINNGLFHYRGSIDKRTPPIAHALLLYFDVDDAQIKYDSKWPAVKKLSGEVFVEPSGVRIFGKKGVVSQSAVEDIYINIPDVEKPAIPHLFLTGKIQSDVSDTLNILQNSPEKIAQEFKDWQGKGKVTGQLILDIPLSKKQEPVVQIDFSTHNADLSLPHPVPPLNKINGSFHYNSLTGLSSPKVNATVFDRASTGTISAIGKNGKAASRVLINGSVNISRLSNWLLQQTSPLPLSGSTPYQLDLTIGEKKVLIVKSNMKGVAVALPAPFDKTPDTIKNLYFKLNFSNKSQTNVELDYDLVSILATLWPNNPSSARGEIRINEGKARITSRKGLQVFGQLNAFDLEQWQAVIKPYLKANNQTNSATYIDFIRDINLRFGKVTGFGIEPQQMAIYIQPLKNTAWRLDVYSKDISGRIIFPLIKNLPYYVSLKYLKLPKSLLDNKDGKTLAAKDFKLFNIPTIDLLISQLYLGDDLLGHVRMVASTQSQKLKLTKINTNLKGLRVKGSLDWNIGHNTSFNGRIYGKDLSTVLNNWKIEPSITSERFNIKFDGNWPGAPFDLKPEILTGKIETHLQNGKLLKVDSSKTNILRLFGILNLDAINRRLRMDFSDLISTGLTYDDIQGKFTINNGIYYTDHPMLFSGPSLNISATGKINMKTEQIDGVLKVGVPLGSSLSFAALAILPPLGGAMLVVDHFIGDQLTKLIAVSYTVKGNWNNPTMTLGK